MTVTRAPQGNQPQAERLADEQLRGDELRGEQVRRVPAPTCEEVLEQVRARIRAAQGSAEQARQVCASADEALADAELLRRRLPVVTSAVEQAWRSVRALRAVTPAALWYAGRRRLAAERASRSAALGTALAGREVLVTRIAEQEARARDLRAQSLRLQADASGLPRLLDEAAAYVRRVGGPAAESLAAAEAGLEPVLRREDDLDQALRWVRWAQRHLGRSLDRLGDSRTRAGYGEYFTAAGAETALATGRLLGHDHPADGSAVRRIEAARQALAGVRDVLAVLCQVLGELGVSTDPLIVPEVPDDLEVWFGTAADDPDRQARVTGALEACERVTAQITTLLERLEEDHAATRRVLDGRRAHWCALLRGA